MKALKVVFILFLIFALVGGGTFGGLYVNAKNKIKEHSSTYELTDMSTVNRTGLYGKYATDNKIHFLNTGSSDCIIIESNGHFGMIDAGEDSDFPADKPKLNFKGYEKEIVEYLKKNCSDENGKVVLDFVIGTHAHSDHIGGFDTVINDEDITVKYGYLKRYNAENIREKEIIEWDNQEVYDQMMTAMQENGVEIVQDLVDVSFDLGEFKIEILNGAEDTISKNIGENDNSLAVLVTKGDKKILLSGDLDNISGDEKTVAQQVGKVDLLKVGHHGYSFSSSVGYLKAVNPDIAVCTNSFKSMSFDVLMNFAFATKAALFYTVDENCIIAEFTDDNQISLYKNAM